MRRWIAEGEDITPHTARRSFRLLDVYGTCGPQQQRQQQQQQQMAAAAAVGKEFPEAAFDVAAASSQRLEEGQAGSQQEAASRPPASSGCSKAAPALPGCRPLKYFVLSPALFPIGFAYFNLKMCWTQSLWTQSLKMCWKGEELGVTAAAAAAAAASLQKGQAGVEGGSDLACIALQQQQQQQPYIVHNNCIIGHKAKIDRFKAFGLWAVPPQWTDWEASPPTSVPQELLLPLLLPEALAYCPVLPALALLLLLLLGLAWPSSPCCGYCCCSCPSPRRCEM
jgi:hypothetical protein